MERAEVLVEVGAGGEEFPGFVRATYVGLVRYGASLVGDADRAEDLVQLALLKLDRAWGRVDPARREAYTRTVMARLAWRQARRRWNGEIPTGALPELPSGGGDKFAMVDDDVVLRGALGRLPVSQRVVLTLRYLDGLSEAEAAQALGCSLGTVKSRSARGIATLRHSGHLSHDEHGPAEREREELSDD